MVTIVTVIVTLLAIVILAGLYRASLLQEVRTFEAGRVVLAELNKVEDEYRLLKNELAAHVATLEVALSKEALDAKTDVLSVAKAIKAKL